MTTDTLISKAKTLAKALVVSLSIGGAALAVAPGSASAGAICNDGWLSSSSGSGTCSWHGGVSSWTSPSLNSYSWSTPSTRSNSWSLPSLGSTSTYRLPSLNSYSWSTPSTRSNSWTLPSLGGTSTYRTGAICRDGWRSSATGSGACSWHGGVASWLP